MHKLKYQGGVTKYLASKIGNANKIKFAKLIDRDPGTVRKEFKNDSVPINLISFSSRNDFYEQILSILSFLRYMGTPISWTIYSDGSHTPSQIQILQKEFEFLHFITTNWEEVEEASSLWKPELLPYKDSLLDYAKKQVLGKRLFLYLNQKINGPTLFLDSDILFYNRASSLDVVLSEIAKGWYLPDVNWGNLDSRYVKKSTNQVYQVNAGFLLFNQNLEEVSQGLNFLESLKCSYEYFTEQTVMHILLNANGFKPLDPRVFVINTDDQFDFAYRHTQNEMAIRHYTGPVRHKMWQKNWKWQLSTT